ncbi:MAG: carbamoyltransferase [Elusimicrobiota bacterium]
MDILGISAFYHDAAACLLRDGKVLAAAQEERFSRKKHDERFPKHAIAYCLKEAGIDASRLDAVAFYDKPLLKFERLLTTYLAYAPKGFSSFSMALPLWIKEKLWIKDLIRSQLQGYEGKIYFPEHHESHAASAFFPSPFLEAAILTMDGVGEWASSSLGKGQGNRIELLKEQHFPHSLGMLYSAFTYYTGFKVNSGEYKVMGLAPYGEPKYKQLIYDKLLDLKQDGSFKLDMRYFDYCAGLTMTNARFNELFEGPPREPEAKLTQKEMDLARSVQEVCEDIVLRTAKHCRALTGSKNLCMAGGVALNCVANGKLLRSDTFERIWIQPAAGDAGGAMGAAMLVWHQVLGKIREADGIHDRQRASLLGPGFSDREIEDFLVKNDIPYKKYEKEELYEVVADFIGDGHVIGWFQGRMEFGPRALGSRSIIGDARSPQMQAKMNLKIKFREGFRPFAPIVLREHVSDYFDMDVESPYMLLVADVRESRRIRHEDGGRKLWGIELLNVPKSDVPAVTHVDYSARIQTVGPENESFYPLLKAFHSKTGCGVLVNTSFNVRGEPIVCTPQDAYRCFIRTHIDYLVLGPYLVDKKVVPKQAEDKTWMKEFALD